MTEYLSHRPDEKMVRDQHADQLPAAGGSPLAQGQPAAGADESQTDLLCPRAQVSLAELRLMPPSLTTAEAMPWTRLSRSAFYRMLSEGVIYSCRLGHSIRIPTRRFFLDLGVLEEDEG